MMWIINGEAYVFDNWEELGMALRDVGRDGDEIKLVCGPICEECNGKGEVAGFVGSSTPINIECFSCDATGIKH